MYNKLKVPEFQDEVVPLHETTQLVSVLDFLFAPKAAYVVLQVSVAAAGRLHGVPCSFGVIVSLSALLCSL